MSVNAVLFDFGMVLSSPPEPATWAQMKQVAGVEEEPFHTGYWAWRDDYDRGSLDRAAYWRQVGETAGTTFDEEQTRTLTSLDVDLWTVLNEPMMEWVQALHRAGVRTGILSNMPDAMAAGICEKFDWIGNFHHTVWSHALKLRKPEPEIYAAATEGLGVPAEQVLFIDDKQENTEAAEAFGMKAIVYSDHAAFENEMRQRGYAYLLDVAQITSV